jgi:hypothetical protein
VDSYHYTNYRASDELCRIFCNPAPTDGSAPNLVGQKVDKNGVVQDVREFNTQTCEQLNAWLGGFESILKRMTSKNFNWFLHVMLFYHVKHVLGKLSHPPVAENKNDEDNDSESEDSDDESSSSSSEEESINSNDVDSTNSEDSDDNDTEVTTTTSTNTDDVIMEDISDEMVEEEEEEKEEEEDEDSMEVDDD